MIYVLITIDEKIISIYLLCQQASYKEYECRLVELINKRNYSQQRIFFSFIIFLSMISTFINQNFISIKQNSIIFMNVFCRLIKVFDDYIVDKNFKISYQSTINSLMYVMLKIRFDITYLIFVISRYIVNLIQTH